MRRLRDTGLLASRLARLDGSTPCRRVYIMGCGRSGTWLLTSLFSTFADVEVIGDESPPERFGLLRPSCPTQVMKRDFESHERVCDIPVMIDILWIVRHPFAVLTSHNPNQPGRCYHIPPRRFLAEMEALRHLLESGRPNVMVVRYEDLVEDPQQVQEILARAYGLQAVGDARECTTTFSGNVEAVKAMHGVRAVDRDSIHRYRDDPDKIQYIEALYPRIESCCEWLAERFGYDFKLPHASAWRSEGAIGMRPLTVRRFETNPLISPACFNKGRDNINGPSVIRVPEWLPGRMGNYYMYFAQHAGDRIDLAYADSPEGPWSLHPTGTLRLEQAGAFCDHIASPDVHVDHEQKTILMFFHGVARDRQGQWTALATSANGIDFKAGSTLLGKYYFRVWQWQDHWYALARDGRDDGGGWGLLYRSPNPSEAFECRGDFLKGMRHAAVVVRGCMLEIFYSRVGDAPERILRCVVDMRADWTSWTPSEPVEVIRPVFAHEGADEPLIPSRAGSAIHVNELRDPFVLTEGGGQYLYYTMAGESGICGAALLS